MIMTLAVAWAVVATGRIKIAGMFIFSVIGDAISYSALFNNLGKLWTRRKENES